MIGDADNFQSVLDTPLSETDFHRVDLAVDGAAVVLRSLDMKPFAMLNSQASATMFNFLSERSIRASALIPHSQVTELIQKSTGGRRRQTLLLDFNIYGHTNIKSSVGMQFSKARLFLQDPDNLEGGVKYDNPHILALPEPKLMQPKPSRHLVEPEMPDHPKFDDSIRLIYNSLSRSLYLRRLEADSCVKTPLLPHQKEALDFIYTHIITEVVSETLPDELGYGLLADEMGLGKTLSALANITRTSKSAYEFMHMHMPDSNDKATMDKPKLRARATLIIVPTPGTMRSRIFQRISPALTDSADLIDEWSKEIDRQFYKYHGRNRKQLPEKLADNDAVFTTYFTLAAEAAKSEGCLHGIFWYRIVLDEAHIIRQQATKLARAVLNLTGYLRWCLTGTPIQNRLEDLAALLSFLRPKELKTKSEFRRHLLPNFENDEGDPYKNIRLLLDSICLRRPKDILDIPPIHEKLLKLDFLPTEKAFYDRMEAYMLRSVQQLVYHKSSACKEFGLFQMHLRLRRVCNHGTNNISPPSNKTLAFESANVQFRRIDGAVGLFKRQKILEEFSHDSNVAVLLMTTGTGAVGLNLTAANFIYIFEPQWNPAVESQAVARATRLGQQRSVTVIRYVIRDTFEEVSVSPFSLYTKIDLGGCGLISCLRLSANAIPADPETEFCRAPDGLMLSR
ncbi:MAG: hypothetical protein Q9160_007015 [Pyrenula sp. 1 TL-2023]